jgi:hypothetical protein
MIVKHQIDMEGSFDIANASCHIKQDTVAMRLSYEKAVRASKVNNGLVILW